MAVRRYGAAIPPHNRFLFEVAAYLHAFFVQYEHNRFHRVFLRRRHKPGSYAVAVILAEIIFLPKYQRTPSATAAITRTTSNTVVSVFMLELPPKTIQIIISSDLDKSKEILDTLTSL